MVWGEDFLVEKSRFFFFFLIFIYLRSSYLYSVCLFIYLFVNFTTWLYVFLFSILSVIALQAVTHTVRTMTLVPSLSTS